MCGLSQKALSLINSGPSYSLSPSLSACSEETINVDQMLPLDHPYNLAVTENFDGFVDAMLLDVA